MSKNSSFYNLEELAQLGLKSIGQHVFISRNAKFYSPETISIGDHVRIDDFCILSGNISLHSYIHVSAYTALYGKYGIIAMDFVTISGRVMIYSQNDDYSGLHLTNPMVPAKYSNVTGSEVRLEKHAIVGSGSIILPGCHLNEGACLASMSLLKNSIEPFAIYGGVPARKIGTRSNDLLELGKDLIQSIK